MIHQTARTQDEAVETVLGVQFLNSVEETGNHVVTAGSLTTRKDNTHVDLCSVGNVALLELDQRHTISVGEQLLDVLLIVNTLCRSALLHLHGSLKSLRQFRLIGSTSQLQCTFFHNTYLIFKRILEFPCKNTKKTGEDRSFYVKFK